MFHRNVNILMSTLEMEIWLVQKSFKDSIMYMYEKKSVHFLL